MDMCYHLVPLPYTCEKTQTWGSKLKVADEILSCKVVSALLADGIGIYLEYGNDDSSCGKELVCAELSVI